MSEKLIHEGWLDYKAKVVPPDMSDAELIQVRAAFYGGAAVAVIWGQGYRSLMTDELREFGARSENFK